MSVQMDQERDVERERGDRPNLTMVVCEEGVRSTAAIASHPMHPMLIVFPIAFLLGALATDIAYWADGDPFWARASLWLIGGGLATGAIAAILGLVDFATIRRAREGATGWGHALGNTTAIALALANLFLRLSDTTGNVVPVGVLVSALTGGILLVTAWMGGELSYRRKIGVIECRSTG